MYWCLSWDPPADFKDAHAPKLNANDCMDKGRSIVRYEAHGTTWVKPIGKSWKGDPYQPRADTRVPVLVHDEDCDELQHLRPHEAQLLMGMEKGITSGPSTTPKEELKAIGNGWDLNVVGMFFAHIDGKSGRAPAPAPEGAEDDEQLQVALALYHRTHTRDEFITLLSRYEAGTQAKFLRLLANFNAKVDARKVNLVGRGSVLDSGSSRHIDSRVVVTNADDVVSLTGFDNSQ
jgi:hypothetical protein